MPAIRYTLHASRIIALSIALGSASAWAQGDTRPDLGGVWTNAAPAELSFHATDGLMYEYACHEGNYAMPGILAGARLQEREDAAQQ